jgi:hypothetical protein
MGDSHIVDADYEGEHAILCLIMYRDILARISCYQQYIEMKNKKTHLHNVRASQLHPEQRIIILDLEFISQ